MLERRGNRFHPNKALPSRGRLGVLIARAWRRVRRAGRGRPYTKAELELTSALVELLAFREDWDKLMEVASRAVVNGCGPKARLRFYRAWIEGLRATNDVEALQTVGKHLLLQRHESPDYVALACLALTHAGRRNYAKVTYRHLVKNVKTKSALVWEAIAVWLSESPSFEERSKGVTLLARLCSARKHRYFTIRNYLSYALEADELEHASTAYNAMHDAFPFAPEPYLASARIAMEEGDHAGAAIALQELLADNPRHVDALLALATCLEHTGDLLAARDLLTSSQPLLDSEDHDVCVTLASINKKLFVRYGNEIYRRDAIRQYYVALRLAARMGLPQGAVHAALLSLDAGVGEQVVADKGIRKDTAERKDALDETVWMLVADDALCNGLSRLGDVVLRAPSSIERGAKVLLARPSPRLDGVELVTAVLEVTSPVVPDVSYGRAVTARVVKTLSVPVEVELHDVRYPHRDGWGCENFAANDARARFYELPLAELRDLVALLEQGDKRRASDLAAAARVSRTG